MNFKDDWLIVNSRLVRFKRSDSTQSNQYSRHRCEPTAQMQGVAWNYGTTETFSERMKNV